MANYSATFSGDFTSYIAGKIFDAANMAKEERERAIEEAKKYDVDPKLRRGEFFGRALQSQFGGDLYNRTLGIFDPRKSKPETDRKSSRENRYSAQFKYPDRFARGQSVVDPLIGTPAHVRNLPEYQRIASPEERKFKSESKMIQTARPEDMFGGKDKTIKVKDQKLGVFLAAVAESINASITSINQKLDETQSGVIEAKVGIAGTIKKLEYNADSLEQRLDAIIATLREQMQQAKKQTDKSEIKQKSQDMKEQSDMSGTQRYVGVNDNQNDVRQLNLLEDNKDRGAEQLSLPIDDNQDGFERGGIATGPDSGYYAKLHGNEQIIPLDNNYTQGEPSAVDGKVRPKPEVAMLPKYEMGTSPEKGNIKTMDDMFNKVIPVVMNDKDRKEVKDESEKLYAGMELIPKATGIVTLGLLQNSLGMMGPLAGAVAPLIKTLSSPIASSFGVPNTVTDKVVKQQETETAEKTRRKVTQSTPAMSTPTSGSQSPSGSGFQWWNPFSWFRGNNNNGRRTTGSGGGTGGGFGRFVTGMATPIERMINAVAPVSNRRTTAKGLRGTNLKRIMHGTGEGVPNLIRNNGFRGQMGMLGEGVYGSVKGWVADTYRGAGKFKGVLPGQGPRLDMLVPQGARTLRGATVVSPRQANRGLRMAEGILSGKYTGPKAQSLLPLLTQQTPTMLQAAQRSGMGLAKLFSKFIGVLNLPVVGDALFPEGTAQYDQLTGPNAYYNAPGYKGPKPFNPPRQVNSTTANSNTLNTNSKNTAIARLRHQQIKLDPIILNNVQNAGRTSPPAAPIRAIETTGVSPVAKLYPPI